MVPNFPYDPMIFIICKTFMFFKNGSCFAAAASVQWLRIAGRFASELFHSEPSPSQKRLPEDARKRTQGSSLRGKAGRSRVRISCF